MSLSLPPAAAACLAEHHVMTIATQGVEGPWAAAVFYAVHEGDLIFLSAPATRHCRNLALDPRCAATIHAEVDDWQDIQGLQLEGRVSELQGGEQAQARQRYGERFPFVQTAGVATAIAQALARVRWYRLRIERLTFIDNRRGLGHREQFDA